MEEKRFFEIDLLRFIAIILMIIFHFIYDLNVYGKYNINYYSDGWRAVGEISGFCFIFVSGLSCGFSQHIATRGVKIFSFGMLITITTYFAIGDEYVRFGILHLLGISILFYLILNKLNTKKLLLLSIIAYLIGMLEKGKVINTFLLLPFGLYYRGFESVDYYPIFPYIAYFILGIIAYRVFYQRGRKIISHNIQIPLITKISKYSLWIYLLHQPIIVGIFILFNNRH